MHLTQMHDTLGVFNHHLGVWEGVGLPSHPQSFHRLYSLFIRHTTTSCGTVRNSGGAHKHQEVSIRFPAVKPASNSIPELFQ
jgi:hypothetical protein